MIKKIAAAGVMAGAMLFSPVVGQAAMGDETLRQGMWDQDIHELQAKLKALGYFNYKATTGYYGSVTKDAVTKFQRAKGLKVDGIAGPQTFSAINNSSFQKRSFSVEATAYTAECEGCSGTTANGTNLKETPYAKMIAVDPNVIPLNSVVYVEGYGYAVAGDTGGGIDGNEIDIYKQEHEDAVNWGRRTVKITVIN
ncbi:peptidoglycan-binding protein [Fictibacillus iocasae]|uniref:Peptidoglycan-binding protein n=1 Tax=Fictibacillus iocasae TaxID=2715437 RepID=A0ABW2NLR6_9BACL